MKSKLILLNAIVLFLITIFSCSKDSEIESQIEKEVTRCFVVKEIDTNIPVFDALVTLRGGFGCAGGGCGYSTFARGETNNIGEVCLSISQSEWKDITSITCSKSGYEYLDIRNPSSSLSEIFLVKRN